jgi:hypothetical protein
MDPGLTIAAAPQDFFDHAADLWTVNYPSLYVPAPAPAVVSVERTAVSALAKESVWTLSVTGPADLPITVPPTLTLPAGGAASFAIGVDKSALGPGVARHATLTLAYKKYRAHLPITAVGDLPLPDLVLTTASVSSPLHTGDDMTVSATVANRGNAPATALFAIEFALSADTVFDGSDRIFAFCTFNPDVAPGATPSCNFTVAFGAGPPAGTYHVLVTVDRQGLVAERDETNNVTVLPGTVAVQ